MSARTIAALTVVLEQEGADFDQVVMGDGFQDRDDVCCIRPYRDDRTTPARDVWETFYWERGKQDRRTFHTEAEACAYFLSWVRDRPWMWRKVNS